MLSKLGNLNVHDFRILVLNRVCYSCEYWYVPLRRHMIDHRMAKQISRLIQNVVQFTTANYDKFYFAEDMGKVYKESKN